MPPVHFVIARTFPIAMVLLVLLASACGSEGPPSAPADEPGRGRPDASSARKRDAGGTTNAQGDGAEAEGEVGDTSANAEPTANVGASATHDASTDHDAGAEGESDPGAGTDETESCETLTYDSFGRAFIGAYCLECHNSSSSTSKLGGIALETLPLVVKNKTYLKRVVIPRPDGMSPPMPKGGNPLLTDAERTKFGAWIDCGPN